MKCPKCGREVPNETSFCAVCGSPVGVAHAIATQDAQKLANERSRKTPDWLIVCIILAVVAIIMIPVLAYSMPWSKIKVTVSHQEHGEIGVDIYIDGILKGSVGIDRGTTIVGVWSVDAGTHTVQIDSGDWYFVDNWLFADYWAYEGPDGYADFTYAYEVGPLNTKNVYITVS